MPWHADPVPGASLTDSPDLSTHLGPRAYLQHLIGDMVLKPITEHKRNTALIMCHVAATKGEDIEELVKLPEGCDQNVWQYEHLTELTKDLGLLSVALNQVAAHALSHTFIRTIFCTTFIAVVTLEKNAVIYMIFASN